MSLDLKAKCPERTAGRAPLAARSNCGRQKSEHAFVCPSVSPSLVPAWTAPSPAAISPAYEQQHGSCPGIVTLTDAVHVLMLMEEAEDPLLSRRPCAGSGA
jgi:hypothetical protein